MGFHLKKMRIKRFIFRNFSWNSFTLEGGSCAPVLELEFRNCFWVQKTEFHRRPLQIALPAVAYEFRKTEFRNRPLQIALPAVAYEFRKTEFRRRPPPIALPAVAVNSKTVSEL